MNMNLPDTKIYSAVIKQIGDTYRQCKYTGEKLPSIGGRKPTKEEEKVFFEAARYWDKKLGYYIPSDQIKASIVNASKKFKVPGEGKMTFWRYTGSGIFIEPAKIPLNKDAKVEIGGHFVKDKKGATKWTTYCEISNWKAEFQITNVFPEKITDDYLENFLKYAGSFIGIGNNRPELGKPHGKFEVIKLGITK